MEPLERIIVVMTLLKRIVQIERILQRMLHLQDPFLEHQITELLDERDVLEEARVIESGCIARDPSILTSLDSGVRGCFYEALREYQAVKKNTLLAVRSCIVNAEGRICFLRGLFASQTQKGFTREEDDAPKGQVVKFAPLQSRTIA